MGITNSHNRDTCLSELLRRQWKVSGQVQGVGFRPFVVRLATGLELAGTVRNDPSGVTIEAFGRADRLEEFRGRLQSDAPPLAQIDRLEMIAETSVGECPVQFEIVASSHEATERGRVTVDSSVCDECLGELFEPSDRRYRHALINCTNCGPRYTIIGDLPYDRPRTTMAAFRMCDRCESEYVQPSNRRFHAQPTCCPECGPRVRMTGADGCPIEGDPFEASARLLERGGILAMKGLGGYHLVVRADDEGSCRRLRQRKHRDHKPFAIMVRDLKQACQLALLSHEAESLLASPVCPIVLATATGGDHRLAPSVASGCHRLGVMLPDTPMQHLLFAEPAVARTALVMTSANLSDDPLIKNDDEAQARLAGLCDAFLLHDRPIERAIDDSVVADTLRGLVPLRRARGYVPLPLPLPIAAWEPGLCVGGELKNAVGLVRRDSVVLSEHVGDLTNSLAYRRFRKTIEDLQRLFEIEPRWVACDRHPQYLSRRFAKRFAAARGIEWFDIQHHHAHLASLAAEHGRTDPIIGLVCDGVGYGDDGTAWGGEVLIGDLITYRRAGRVRPLRLPGGDAAAKQIGRCAAGWLFDLLGADGRDHPASRRVLPNHDERRVVFSMLQHDFSCPASSGLGRLFDAAAALLGVCEFNHYEAMSGLLLEAAASRAVCCEAAKSAVRVRSRSLSTGPCLEFDTRLLLRNLLHGMEREEPVEELAWRFHDVVAAGFSEMAERVSGQTGVKTVGLSGGVFCNALLTDLVADRLERFGLEVLIHRQTPPNDGGLAYGQAAIVAARRERGRI